MSRMDRYLDSDELEKKELSLSRTEKNQRMYEDVYYNASVVDIDNYLNEEEKKDTEDNTIMVSTYEQTYEEKNYSIDDYLEKAREKKTDDDALRDLNNNEFQNREDEISKLIASIDEKEENIDFFEDLRGNDENTLVKGQMKTDEFNEDIYKTLAEEEIFSNTSITSLEKALGDKTVFDLERESEEKLDHTFEKIMESDRIIAKKQKKLPIVVFSITLFMLIIVIILVLIFK